ncbi:MAG TPA: cytochrome c [Candidatus Binatia bacterium]|nr:cytochrome c [Candidatus Binatia bacterium]
MHTRNFLRIGFLCLLSLVISSQVFAQEEEIQKRRLLMETNNDAVVKSINNAVKEGNFAEVQVKVKGIMENMDKILELFPPGSLSEKSRAKPEIWQKWDEFSQHPGKVKKAAQELADAAKAKDEVEVKAKLKALGEACTSCHNSFRAPRKAN